MILLVGKRDFPTDGVQDYCEYLGEALGRRGVDAKVARVDGVSEGWLSALRGLWNDSHDWRGRWVIMQYTALSWSAWGFPFGAVAALVIVRRRGGRCAVVFHEPFGLSGPRAIDRIRGACQNWVVKKLHDLAEKSIFPTPLESVAWLLTTDPKAKFISIGANVPGGFLKPRTSSQRVNELQTVAIFCLSGLPYLREELEDISEATKVAKESGADFRLLFIGRGTSEASSEISQALRNIPVEYSNLGVVSAERVSACLSEADAMLCVRGRVYPRRSSALAGIASGLPLIGYAGEAENTPLADAGLVLVPYRDRAALGMALARVLASEDILGKLRERSVRAYEQHFSWNSIAASVASFLGAEQK
jgi:glycosyltransferase involved in cell wall biosynthesis